MMVGRKEQSPHCADSSWVKDKGNYFLHFELTAKLNFCHCPLYCQ